jgi:hypothetical protein
MPDALAFLQPHRHPQSHGPAPRRRTGPRSLSRGPKIEIWVIWQIMPDEVVLLDGVAPWRERKDVKQWQSNKER